MSRDAWQRGWMSRETHASMDHGPRRIPASAIPSESLAGIRADDDAASPSRAFLTRSGLEAGFPERDENVARGASLTVAGAAQVDVRSTNRTERALLPV